MGDPDDDSLLEEEEERRVRVEGVIAGFRRDNPRESESLSDQQVLALIEAGYQHLYDLLFADGRESVSLKEALEIIKKNNGKTLH